MGLFNRSKNKEAQVVQFLNRADDAYILAHDSKNIRPFAPYADPAVCTKVLSKILSGEDKYFGTSKLRKREWDVQLDGTDVAHVVKRTGHEEIKVGRGITIPLGDPDVQCWDVSIADGKSFKIIRMGGCGDE